MATQVVIPAATSHTETWSSPPTITLPSDFQIHSQDGRLKQKQQPATTTKPPTLGVLSAFSGTFAGHGFNLIFRPNSANGTTFPIAVKPPPPAVPNDNVLEINLTSETLSFSPSIGSVPNRGFGGQGDIFLNGVPYVQAISDVSDPATGKADAKPCAIHFEPGLWMHVPATTNDPVQGESLVRMASIPHGTTVNAQCLTAPTVVAGPPSFPEVDITPIIIATGNKVPPGTFPQQTASTQGTSRLPQDLTTFIAAGTITQAMLTDPNTVLRNAIVGQTITKTTFFTVSTTPAAPIVETDQAEAPTAADQTFLKGASAATNIAFLQGTPAGTTAEPNSGASPNASAVQMTATFWIEEVQNTIDVPVFKTGQAPLKIQARSPHPGAQVPTFVVNPPHDMTAPTTITVSSTQIQYSQTVFLNFAGLTWPHVSCNTLTPTEALPVPPSAWE